jgi:ankyrin repeat protein/predicted DNA-binding WGR domain protein
MGSKNRELFKNGDFLAVLDEADQDYHFTVYQTQESVKASYPGSQLINVTLFNRDPDNDLKFVSTDEENQIEVSHILRRVVKTSESIHEDEEGVERAIITIARKLNNSLIDMANQALLTGSEASGEEEGQEEESMMGKRDSPFKKAKKRKESGASEQEDAESSMQEKAEKKPVPKKERAPKQIVPKEPKTPKAPKDPKPAKEPKPKKEKKVKKVVDYKRGKFNIKIKEPEIDPALDGLEDEPDAECCDVCSNREVYRAVRTNNQKLFQNILKNKSKITTILQDWSAHNGGVDPLILAIKENKTWFIDAILNEMKPKEKKEGVIEQYYKSSDKFGLESIGTGENSKYAYGVKTRTVSLGRGNREGNNAFMHDEGLPQTHDNYFFDILEEDPESGEGDDAWEVLMKYASPDTFKKILAQKTLPFESFFAKAVRTGNRELAGMIAERLLKDDGYGLNELHVKSLTANTLAELGQVKSVSVKKKNIGRFLICPIFCAAINPNFEVFQAMFDALTERFLKDENMSGIMMYAALNPNPEIMQYLLDQGMEFREANKQKLTPLMMAAKFGMYKNVELLLKKGELSKKKDRSGMGAIHYAAYGGHIETIRVILENQGDVNLPGKDRMSALAIASSQGQYETVKFLLSKGAKTVKKDKFKRSPLILALMNNYTKIAGLLISHGCPVDEPDSSDNYPIHYACAYGTYHAIDILIGAGANPNVHNSWKLTPIAVAMLKNHFKIINKLLTYPNIDVNCKDDKGRTLLSNSVRNITQKTVDFIELIIDHHNADVKIPDLEGDTALHHLLENVNTSCMQVAFPTANQPNLLRDMAISRTQLYIRLIELLTRKSLVNLNLKNKEKKTALILLMENFGRTFKNVLQNVPSESKYDQEKRTYIKKYLDYHSYLAGDIDLKRGIWELFTQIFKKVAEFYGQQVENERAQIVDELAIGGPQEPVSVAFSIANEGILSQLVSKSQELLFRSDLRSGFELAENANKKLTQDEISHSIAILALQKEYFQSLVQLMISQLKINVQGKNYESSAKSEVLGYLKSRWYNLYIVPEEKPVVMMANSANSTNSGSLFGHGGGIGGLFGNSGNNGMSFGNNNRNNDNDKNKGQYINLQSTGVDNKVMESLKAFRANQIREREKITLELLELISSNSNAAQGENWTEQHQFCSKIIAMLPSVFFIKSVEALDMKGSKDAKYVYKCCEEMIQSNSVIGKKFIQLAQIGATEYKAQLIGSERSLFTSFSSSLLQVSKDLSMYTDFNNEGTGSEILIMELRERLEFIFWVLQEFSIKEDQKRAIEAQLAEEINKPNTLEKAFDRNKLLTERRVYQRSLLESDKKLTAGVVKDIVLSISTMSKFPDRAINSVEKLELIGFIFTLGYEILKENYNRISSEFLPFIRKDLLSSVIELATLSISGTTRLSAAIETEKDLSKRGSVEFEVKSMNNGLLTYTHQFILKTIGLFTTKLSTTTAKATSNEITQSDYVRCNQFAKVSSKGDSILKDFFNYTNKRISIGLPAIYDNLRDTSIFTKDISQECSDSILDFQKTELDIMISIAEAIIAHEIFIDNKELGRFDMSQILWDLCDNLNCVLENVTDRNREFIQNAKLKLLRFTVALIEQFISKSFNEDQPDSEELKNLLTKRSFDKIKNSEVTWRIELEEYLESVERHPLLEFLVKLNQNMSIFSFFKPGNFDLSNEDIALYEVAKGELTQSLFSNILKVMNYQKKNPEIKNPIVFTWGNTLYNYFLSPNLDGVIHDKEIASQNNDSKFLNIIDQVNSHRSKFIVTLSEFFIQRFNLKESYNGEYLPKRLFEAYLRHGWNINCRRTLLSIFESFFQSYGDLCLDIPKIKNPLFYLAENPNFDKIYWRPITRVDYEFHEFIMKKVSNPNIRYIFEKQGTDKNVGLFLTGFTALNSNFLRALINHPSFNKQELFEAEYRENLASCIDFVECEDDLLFVSDYVNIVKMDELIIENVKNGRTPFIYFLLRFCKTSVEGSTEYVYLRKNIQVFINFLRLFVQAGASFNSQFDNKERYAEYLAKGTTFTNIEFQGFGAIHFSLFNKPSIELVKYLVQEVGVNINHQDFAGNTALSLAASKFLDRTDVLKLLLENKADPNLANKKSQTPIFSAANSGNLDIIELFKSYNANLDLEDENSLSPLTILIKDKNITGIEKIISIGANVNFTDKFHRNSLHWAINYADHTANSSFEIEDILIRNGVQINTKDKLGRTPLHYPFVKITDFTIVHCIDPIESVNSLLEKKNLKIDEHDIFGFTPLMYAAQRGSLVSALYLLDKKAQLNTANVEGNTPLGIAMMNLHDNLAITLLNNGADWNTSIKIYNKDKRATVYSKVLATIKEGKDIDLSQYFKTELETRDEAAEAKNKEYNSVTQMHIFRWAIRNNWQGLAYMILSKGYDIGEAVYSTILERKFNYTFTLLTKREENTPYLFVGENGDNIAHLISLYSDEIRRDLLEKIFRVLIKKGIEINCRNKDGHLSIHCAAICGSKIMIEFLMEHKIDPNERDNKGRSALMLAAQKLKFEAIMCLFPHMKEKNENDSEGRTVLHYLCMNKSVSDDMLCQALNTICSEVDANKADSLGKVPLHYLLKNSAAIESIKYLTSLTKNIHQLTDKADQTLLHTALKCTQPVQIIELLLRAQINLNSADKKRRTPFGQLILNASYSVSTKVHLLTLLAPLGMNPDLTSSFFIGVDLKTKQSLYETMSIIDYLLHSNGSEELIIQTLKLGAKLDIPNSLNQKSLEIILNRRKSHYLLTTILANSLPSVSISCDFYMPSQSEVYKDKPLSGLSYLIESNANLEVVRELVIRGVDINKVDKSGISAFAYAVSEQKFSYITPLLEGQEKKGGELALNVKVPKKFNLFKEAPKYTTPLNYTIKYRVFDQVKILLLNKADPNFKVEADKPAGYYLIKYCLTNSAFADFLRRFQSEKDFAISCSSLAPLMKVDFDFKMGMTWDVSKDKQEAFEVDPLYYAVANKITNQNLALMLDHFPSLNYVNPYNNRSAFAEALLINKAMAISILTYAVGKSAYQTLRKSLPTEDKRTPEQRKINLNLKMALFDKEGREAERVYPLNKMMLDGHQTVDIVRAIKHGANYNLQDGPRNLNLIMLAIHQNDCALVKLIMNLVEQGRGIVSIDKTCTDNLGRTPIHLVVNSHKNGSFENVELLRELAKYFDINKGDNNNLPPIHYASLQDSGRMLEALESLGAKEYEVPFGVRRAPTSLISFASFPASVPNFEEDAEVYYKQKEQEYKAKAAVEEKGIELDSYISSNMKQTSRVLCDDLNNPYDLYMTKVDIKKGQFSGNVFYRMQLLHETNRDVYFIFTRYGRIGDSGQYQTTSFSTLNEAIQEFKNIFKSKSGNEWANAHNFHRIKNKYKLVKFSNTSEREYLTNYYDDHNEKDLPNSNLSDYVKTLFAQVVSTKVMYSRLKNLKVDVSKLPLSKLNKNELMQALNLLYEIKKTAADLKVERAVDVMNSDPEKIFELLDELCEMTSDYYGLIPSTKYINRSIQPLERENDINENIMLVKELLEVEVAVKVLLGANLNIRKIHPIDYCFNSMNIKLMELENLSIEREAILDYISKSHDYGHPESVKIFGLERKGETERFAKHLKTPNRKLLWHGSRTMNFLGILNKGLKIAPPEAPTTGQLFGKGIYFADTFRKAHSYTEGQTRILLLCEVALGKSWELTVPQTVTSLPEGHLSVKGVGISTPNPKKDVYIPNGMILPLGELTQRDNTSKLISLQYDEYVVYNEDQVKVRYMVCIQ